MKIKKSSLYLIYIFLILTFNFHCFYLINADKVPLDDIAFILEILFFVYVFLKFKKLNTRGYAYLGLMIGSLLLGITSSIAANIEYAQPFFLGFRAQRWWIMSLNTYFPIRYLLKSKKISINDVIDTIYFFSFIYLIISTVQYILASKIIFLNVSINNHYGSYKFYFDESILVFLFSIAFYRIISKGGKNKILNSILCIWILIFLYQFTKYRSILLALILSLILFIMLDKHISIKKIVIMIIILIGVFLFSKSDLGATILNALKGNDNSFNMRTVGREFYFTKLKGNYFFGNGFISILWQRAYIEGGIAQNIYYTDNGIIGVIFYYGIFGLIWWIAINIKALYHSLTIRKFTKDFSYLIFITINLLIIITGLPNYFDNTIVVALFLAILETRYSEIMLIYKKNKKEKQKYAYTY